ncbi:hypothetical protein FALBO_13644 [Fusarium albosuccineum]|uniref:Uncharacterized protein n=1 Tax=Fusarium albosuccineum TaxID=1237068 RepID=A0A8H4L1M3_9HYPO|nr:hypothetical protein FALBO_13644 [Fusarium albosuccineum]
MNRNEPGRRGGRRGPRRPGRGNRRGGHHDAHRRGPGGDAAQIPAAPGFFVQPPPNQAYGGHAGGYGLVQPNPYGVQVWGAPHPAAAHPWNQGWAFPVAGNPYGNQLWGPPQAIPHGIQAWGPALPPQALYGNQVGVQAPNQLDNNQPHQPGEQQTHGPGRRRQPRGRRRQMQRGGQRALVGPGQRRFVVLEVEPTEEGILVQLRGQAAQHAENQAAADRRDDRPAERQRDGRA